jgi:hypothetical protein
MKGRKGGQKRGTLLKTITFHEYEFGEKWAAGEILTFVSV